MAWTQRFDGTEVQRVNKWLGQAGVCSRREAEALILAGRVSIDGCIIGEVGQKILPGQVLSLSDGSDASAAISIVIHKPVGVVSAHPEAGQIQALDLLTQDRLVDGVDFTVPGGTSLPPLGRLDRDSRGLLLLSEDGVLAKAVIGPQSELEKEYRVRVVGTITARKLDLLRHGLTLDNRLLRYAEVTQLGAQELGFVLREGRKRQIRRMAESVSLSVVDLKRIRVGPLWLGELPEGRWRPLAPSERNALIHAAGTHAEGPVAR